MRYTPNEGRLLELLSSHEALVAVAGITGLSVEIDSKLLAIETEVAELAAVLPPGGRR